MPPFAPCSAAYLLAKSALFSVHCKYYHHNNRTTVNGRQNSVKATGIVRRIDDLGRVVIPNEIRRTLRIREGDPLQMALTPFERFCFAMCDLAKRQGWN